MPILRYGTSEQKKSFLPKIAQGELIMTLAFLEPSCSFDEQGIQSTADRENDIYNINGTKLFVPDAHVANYLLCPARAKEGVTLFLVDATNPRIKCTLLKTITSDKQCEVIFDKVGVPRGNVLGEVGNGWQIVEKIKEWGAIAQCSFVFGGVQRVLELTVSYAKERIQFGKPIGSFQRVQNHCTDMAMDIEGIKWLTYEAAWRLSEGLPAAKEISMAKAWASDASRRIGVNAHRVHAGIGLFTDYDIELYFRRAKAMELAFGDGDFHREIVAKELGLC
jgi:alkylation response protein AidB-like acyl-CoA dehydrogenase